MPKGKEVKNPTTATATAQFNVYIDGRGDYEVDDGAMATSASQTEIDAQRAAELGITLEDYQRKLISHLFL